jgi:hypothetical protein
LCFQPGEKSGNEGGWDRAGRDQLPANEVDPQVEPLEPVCPEKYHVTGSANTTAAAADRSAT